MRNRKFKLIGGVVSAAMLVGMLTPLSVMAAQENGWEEVDGNKYWYENGVKQGLEGRGKEIADPDTGEWYWLDSVDGGKMATDKDLYQESKAGQWAENFVEGDWEASTGKWVRYDVDGHMVKGWGEKDGNTYYFDLTYGTMAKGYATIDGQEYYFNTATGVKERELGSVPEGNSWKTVDGVEYWYENGIRQGYSIDASYRGKEIYDPDSDAWYWLDNIDEGKKAVSKDVYQESEAGDWAENLDGTGKWVRYDAEGHMVKGWSTNADGAYYFDPVYGTMAKGTVIIDGQEYGFDEQTGLLVRGEYFDDTDGIAPVINYAIELPGASSTNYRPTGSFFANTPDVITFFDYMGRVNVAYVDGGTLNIQRYNDQMALVTQLSLDCRYPLFGNITCDSGGNYYIVWGQNDTDNTNCVVMSVAKYDYNGSFLAECSITGYDSTPYAGGDYWGTKLPFDAGNCSVAISDGLLAVNYAREMYSGHQSNFVFYVDCATMQRQTVEYFGVPYVSHSFDQRVIALSDGGFLMANQGDAFDRSFTVSKIAADKTILGEVNNFHFREGPNRNYGYNETFAQLGGLAETENAYVFCGSSERTLSLDTAPTNTSRLGHSEARDLFIQILKKDFYNYTGSAKYLVEGKNRSAVGTKPFDALTELWLSGDEEDYGILWLTDYSDEYYAANPKVMAISEDRFVVMWEKRAYVSYGSQVETYYSVISENGSIVRGPLLIEGSMLAGNIDPAYHDGKIYWATNDSYGAYIHCLDPLAP